MLKACYSMFNSSEKDLSINFSNMTCYACFQFRQSPFASTIDTIFQESPQPEVTRDSSPDKEETRQSENFSKLPDHLQSGHEAVPALVGQGDVAHHLVWRQ
ncbi:hypothetical protein AVEN_115055-1 [Araneus ventricosus]|uniref:Uncharacterized protein n=1 Tax=Araneus ventricosus TaxID=182803 RepID=A0A4Y1ZXM9_ARAVE|nr:hypothetical protein AVEN_115055-1 [Araneus ventricosus]